ncbi:hypothetical protein ABZ570_28860 [Micromonospora sp. NPDC007271]|uniref:hypothetical protein n=1 Tax=Micromonospora sp. NPDC007271 TaxID=3154587 RepID=UPI0033C66839
MAERVVVDEVGIRTEDGDYSFGMPWSGRRFREAVRDIAARAGRAAPDDLGALRASDPMLEIWPAPGPGARP